MPKTLPDGTKTYTWEELDTAVQEAEDIDVTVSDLILLLLWSDKDKPIFGKTRLVSELYIFWSELVKKDYKVEDPHFYFKNNTPYSDFIIETTENLYFAGYIIIASGLRKREYAYMLSKKSLPEVEEIIKKKIRQEDIEYFKRRRRELETLPIKKLIQQINYS